MGGKQQQLTGKRNKIKRMTKYDPQISDRVGKEDEKQKEKSVKSLEVNK